MLRRFATGVFPGACLLLLGLVVPRGYAGQSTTPEFLQHPHLSGTRGGNLVASINSDPRTFNRLLTTHKDSTIITERLSADLVHLNRVTYHIEPSLASSWDLSKDDRSYTLHLRKGLRFSDGTPLTVDDVLFSFQVALDPKIASPFAELLRVDGALPVITKADAHTVQITFPRPVGTGLRALAALSILPKHRLLKPYQEGKLPTAWGPSVSPQEVVGMGPFRLKEYQPGAKIVLERNPYYWKKDKSGQTLPYLDTLTFLIIPDRNTEALRFQAGELDLLDTVDAENFAGMRRRTGGFKIQDLGPGLEMEFFWFNLNRGANKAGKPYVDSEKRALFEKAEFRRAVSTAIDRQGMARSLLLGLGAPQYGPVSPGNKLWHHPQLPRTDFDTGRAKDMLLRLGLRDGNGDGVLEFGAGRPLEIMLFTTRGNVRREKTAQIIKDNLAKIGIRIEIQTLDIGDLYQRVVQSFDYEAMLFGFIPTDVEPDILTDLWYSHGSNHFWCPKQAKPHTTWEAEIDDLTSRMVRSPDATARKKIFHEIQETWVREMPAIFTVSRHVLSGWKSRVGNLRPSILPGGLLWNAEELTLQK
jgi:peptide/nickel transport system substrate-binding protein